MSLSVELRITFNAYSGVRKYPVEQYRIKYREKVALNKNDNNIWVKIGEVKVAVIARYFPGP
jgi:hypothetical protein